MMLKSARAASLGKGIFDSEASSQYLELMDDQVALELARKGGLGFGKVLLEQISPHGAEQANARGADGVAVHERGRRPSPSFAARLPAMLRALSSGDSGRPARCRRRQTAAARSYGSRAARRRRRALRAPLFARRDRGRAHAWARPAPAARASRARDRLGRRDAAAPRWPLGQQPVRHEGRRGLAGRPRRALDDGALGRRHGAQARGVPRLRPRSRRASPITSI